MAFLLTEVDALGLHLWRHLKYSVYHEPHNTISEIETRNPYACESIGEDNLKRLYKNIENHLGLLLRAMGQFEHILSWRNLRSLPVICISAQRNQIKTFRITAFEF